MFNIRKLMAAFATTFAALFIFINLTTGAVSAQSLPPAATKTLEEANLPGAANLAKTLKGKFKGRNNYFETPRIRAGKLNGVFALYQPAGSRKFILAAILGKTSLGSLGVDPGPMDQIAIGSAVAVYSPDNLGMTDVRKWPGALGNSLRALAPSSSNTKLAIGKSANVFLRFADGKSGEFPALLKEVGLKLRNLTARVHLTKTRGKWTPSAQIMHWGLWNNPFSFKDTSFRGVSILLSQDNRKNRTVQAWGDFKLKNKTYFLWGAVTAGPTKKGRAFGMGAKTISTKAFLDFADILPLTSKLQLGRVSQVLPLDDVKITNDKYRPYKYGVFPDKTSFTVFYAEPGMEVADTGRKGPIFAASGKAKVLKWDAASYEANVDPRRGVLIIRGKMSSPKLDPLPMSESGYLIYADAKNIYRSQFRISGKYQIEKVTLAGASLGITSKRMSMTVDLGCIPPMLKASLNIRYSANIPKPSISPSSCLDAIGSGVEKLAKGAGHAVSGVANEIGGAMTKLGDALSKSAKRPTLNKDLPLTSLAIIHGTLTKTLDGMKKTGTQKVNLTEIILKGKRAPGLPNFVVTQRKLEGMITRLNCTVEGRMFYLVTTAQGAKKAAILPQQKKAAAKFYEKNMAEAKFYPPFKGAYKAVMNAKPRTQAYLKLNVCAEQRPNLI